MADLYIKILKFKIVKYKFNFDKYILIGEI